MKKAVKIKEDEAPQNQDLQSCGLDELLREMSQPPELPMLTEEEIDKLLLKCEIDSTALLKELSQVDMGQLLRELSLSAEVEDFLRK